MTLDHWRELRRQQGVRVANASRHKRPAELQRYDEICGVIAELEAEGIVLGASEEELRASFDAQVEYERGAREYAREEHAA